MLPVIINTFGEFSIAYGDKIIAEKDRRSRKMWTLLKYLTAFMDRGAAQGELIEVIWNGEDINNPAGALKTQLHRLRGVLEELGIGTELVVSFSGTYVLNDTLKYEVDAVIFEDNYKKSQRGDISEKEQIAYIKKAFEIYKGDFLKSSGNEKWAVPIRVYYHSIYIRVVHRLIDALYTYKQYEELISVCRKALLIESADQKIHLMLIKSLIATGDRGTANGHYKHVMDMIYNQLGVNPLPELRDLYRETIDKETDYENDLESVKNQLREELGERSAFFCELEFFKNIYRLKIRDSERSGQPMQICLITVSEADGTTLEPKIIVREMNRLHECIARSLRISDIFARYSVSQYIIMLPTANDETGEMVINRILDRYKFENTGYSLDIDYKHVMA